MFPFAPIDEGHTGVAPFMTLSVFAKLGATTASIFPASFLPHGAAGTTADRRDRGLDRDQVARRLADPIERHYRRRAVPDLAVRHLVDHPRIAFLSAVPLLLFLFRRRQVPILLLAVVAGAILARFDWWRTFGEAQHIAYWTVVGRIDQFVLGSTRCTSSRSCCAISSVKASVALTISSRR